MSALFDSLYDTIGVHDSKRIQCTVSFGKNNIAKWLK